MLISVFCFKIFFQGRFRKLFASKVFFRRGCFEKFWGRLTVKGGGSGQSVSLVSGGIQNWQKKRQLIFEWPLMLDKNIANSNQCHFLLHIKQLSITDIILRSQKVHVQSHTLLGHFFTPSLHRLVSQKRKIDT